MLLSSSSFSTFISISSGPQAVLFFPYCIVYSFTFQFSVGRNSDLLFAKDFSISDLVVITQYFCYHGEVF